MLHVGLTGNIASGKSTVAQMLEQLGATVIDADVLARQAVAADTEGLRAIVRRFGSEYVAGDGTLDRRRLGQLVFRDESARRDLNAIVHPEVGRLRANALREAAAQRVRIVVSDIPLLYETGAERELDAVILVDAPENERLRRLVTTRDLPEADARAMMSAQWPAVRKRPLATFIIENTGTVEQLRERVAEVWHALQDFGAMA